MKTTQENLKLEINLYKYMQSNPLHTTSSFKNESLLLNCIRNPSLRHDLYQQYQIIQEKLQLNAFDSYLESLEMQQEDYQFQYHQIADDFRRFNEALPIQYQLTVVQQHLLRRRTALKYSKPNQLYL